MASEIRVDKINSLSGVGTVTLSPTGVDISGITTVQTLKVGTGLTASEDGDIFFTGVCTATTFAGSGANLTSLPAAQLSGTLPALSAANLTSIPAANVTGTLPAISGANLTSLTAGNLTGALPAISAANCTNVPAANITGTLPAISGANLTNLPASGKASNLIINGAMQVAQRATSSTSSTNGYNSVDRWGQSSGGDDEAPTQAQVDVASGTTPYTLGFRKAYRITNGNQTSGAGAADYYRIYQGIEAQDLAQSGWNYTSSSSYVTLSFWVKSSVAQNFYGDFRSQDGTSQSYPFETGSLSADTWTKITKTIPGHSNITIDNDNGVGAYIFIVPFHGTNYTGSVTLNQWGAYDSALRTPDNTSTWWTTNDATFEITGVQLEVGSTASDFAHRSFGEELSLCERYYQIIMKHGTGGGAATGGVGGTPYTNSSSVYCPILFRCRMRAEPTLESTASSTFRTRRGNDAAFNGFQGFNDAGDHSGTIITNGNAGGGDIGAYIWVETNSGALVAMSAEI